MGKIYNFVLNASNGTGADHSKAFLVDWDKIPDYKPLKLTFSFVTNDTGDAFAQIANIYCNLGQSQNYFGTGDSMTNSRGDYLGFLVPVSYPIAGGLFYESVRADLNTNPPIYLYRRPQQSNITVEIKTSTNQQTNYVNALGNYTLILSFEEIEEK